MKLSLSANIVFLYFLLNLTNTAQAEPAISFNGVLREPGESITGSQLSGPPVYQPAYSESSFKRNLGVKLSKIYDYYIKRTTGNVMGSYTIQELNQFDSSILRVVWEYSSIYKSGTYVANDSGKIFAYALVSPIYIQKFMQYPVIKAILELEENPNYLEQYLNNPEPERLQLKFYELIDDDFIERYGILSYYRQDLQEMQHLLVLDAYYPKALDAFMQEEIIKSLNQELLNY